MKEKKEDCLLVLFMEAHLFLFTLIKQRTAAGSNWITMLGQPSEKTPISVLDCQSKPGGHIYSREGLPPCHTDQMPAETKNQGWSI